MRKYFILLLISSYLQAQVNNGYVIYQTVPIENGSGIDKMRLNINDNFFDRIREFDFFLTFNTKESFFDISKTFKYDLSEETALAKNKVNFVGEILQTRDSIYIDLSSSFLGSNLILKKNIEKKWILLNETKRIDHFLCYKATTEIVRETVKKTFKFPIVAWYCPEINFPFGPLGFGSLPGLILELQTKDAVFGVKKIVFNSNDEIVVPKLKKAKIITEDELNAIIIKLNDDKRTKK